MPPRKRFEPVQSRKTVAGTAAPGVLLETTDGSQLVLPVEAWPYFKAELHKAPENEILDARLRQRLRQLYKGLQKLVRVPANEVKHNFALKDPAQADSVLKGRYFPEWAYCPITRRFQHLTHWRAAWNAAGPTPPPYSKQRDDDNFNPPQSTVARKASPAMVRNQGLEQVRFVLAGSNGEVADVPWPRWVFAQQPERLSIQLANGQRMQALVLDFERKLPPDFHLRYTVQERAGDLNGILLSAHTADNKPIKDDQGQPYRANLGGLYSLRISRADLVRQGLLFGQNGRAGTPASGDEFILFRPIIRSSNSAYYGNSLDSLFIPTPLAQCATDVVDELRRLHSKYAKRFEPHELAQELMEMLPQDRQQYVSADYITRLIAADFQFTAEVNDASEQLHRQAEFDYFAAQETQSYKDPRTSRIEMRFARVATVPLTGLAAVTRVDKLKVITVQPSYTRLTPLPADAVLRADAYSQEQPDVPSSYEQGALPRKQYVSTKGLEADVLPAYENFGEGIFLRFDSHQIQHWERQPAVQRQLLRIEDNYRQSWQAEEGHAPTAGHVLMHTFSHLLMRELEFRCGYQLTALKERLYSGASMQGLLIYTVAGAAGSYGGLVSLTDDDQLKSIIESALLRATDCASDPICWDTDEQGQGVGGLNMAACASCALLPETSCEEFNSLLDRRLVVDPAFGYFKDAMHQEVAD